METIPSSPLIREFFAFNTLNQVSVWTKDATILDEALALCKHYEQLFSRTNPRSELSRLNRAGGKPTEVDHELAGLIDTSLAYCAQSGGLYDVTMGTVVNLWDFNAKILPTKEQITEALRHVDYQRVHVEGTTVHIEDPCAIIDLGGIAKGYIADQLVKTLTDRGVKSALINLGGNVSVLGKRPDGDAWRVGLRKPVAVSLQETLQSFAVIEMSDRSVSTSGTYERAFTLDDQLYHHILDPRTGYPAATDLLGVSLIAESSLEADGYSTALIIMGFDKARAFVVEHPSLEAVFITVSGDIYASYGIGSTLPFRLLDCD